MNTHEDYAQWDAAYVLGALTPIDRRAFEAHLADCDRCRAAVVELSAMPGLLSRIQPPVPPDDAPAPPIDLADRVMLRHATRRRRLRIRIALGTAAAAVVVALAVAVPIVVTHERPTIVALAPVIATDMQVDVEVSSAPWGSRLTIRCDYPDTSSWGDADGPWRYALVATARDGGATTLATWSAVPGRRMTATAATALDHDDIVSLTVTTATGVPLLSADLPD